MRLNTVLVVVVVVTSLLLLHGIAKVLFVFQSSFSVFYSSFSLLFFHFRVEVLITYIMFHRFWSLIKSS